MVWKYIGLVSVMLLGGCGTTYSVSHVPPELAAAPKDIVVFLDGTMNDQTSRTNIAKLYEISVNQAKKDLVIHYAESVGSGNRVIGAAMG